MDKLENTTANGKIYKCTCCNKIYIEYKNLNFTFNEKEFDYFSDFIRNLDGILWETKNANSPLRRKIVIPVGHKNLRVLLNNVELQELKSLLSPNSHQLLPSEIAKLNFNFSSN